MPRTFAVQLALLTASCLFLVTIGYGWYLAERQTSSATANLQHETAVLARNVALASSTHLFTNDLISIENLLVHSAGFRDVAGVLLTDDKGRIISEAVASGGGAPSPTYRNATLDLPEKAELVFRFEKDGMAAWYPIVAGGLHGWVKVRVRFSRIEALRVEIWWNTAIAGALTFLASLLTLSMFLQSRMGPLRSATEFAGKLDARRGETIPVSHGTVEIERLGCALNDVSLRLHAQERELRTNSARLVQAQRIARLGNWDRNIRTGNVWWSEETYGIFGLDPQRFEPSHERFLERVHPEDRRAIEEATKHILETKEPFSVEYRIVRPDGITRIVAAQADVDFDETGSPLRLQGTIQDITERKQAEMALRESEERYRRIYENTPVMLHSIDREGRLLSVSDYWLEVLGYEREEVIGHKAYDFCSEGSRREANEKHLPEFFRTGVAKDISYQFVKKSGQVIDVLLSAIAVRDEQGDFVRSLAVMIDVTERKRAEERFRRYFDLPLVGSAIYAPDKRWIEVNDKLCDLIGYTRDELMALTWVDITHPDDLAENLRLFDRALSGEGDDAYTMDKRFVRKDGETLHASVSTQCVLRPDGAPDYFIVLVQDLTERKRAEDALRESEERFKAFFQNSPAVLSLRDTQMRYVLTNREHEKLVGKTSRQVMGKMPHDIIPAEHADLVMAHQREVLESGKAVQREETYTEGGKDRYFLTVKFPVPDVAGDPVGVGSIAIDITERKKTEAQLIRASRLATLGEMASGIAHELNQPLTNMRMMAENALAYIEGAEVDADVQTRKLEGVIGQVDRMAGIVDHMRLFSRKDSAKRETFSPTACAADAIGMVENQYRALGIRLERDLPARCRNVSGHRFKLEQVILNLLSNAHDAAAARAERAAREGGEYVPAVAVGVAEDRKTDTVILSVTDNGGGVPEDVLGEIFDPFFTTKAEGHGTGLGLSISYSIIDTMGGRIEARNVAGGARFDVILPVADEAHPRLPAPKPQEQPPPPPDRRGRLVRVLVVDDEEPTARNTAEYLEYAGYDAATAGNGAEALKLFTSNPFDVVVTDRRMPVMDGNQLIRRLRAVDPNLPIIAMTGQGASDDGGTDPTAGNDGAAAGGPSVVLRKPVRLRDLEDHVRRLTRA